MGTCGSKPARPPAPPKESAQSAEARQRTEQATQQVAAEIAQAVEQEQPADPPAAAPAAAAEQARKEEEEKARKEDDDAQDGEERERRRKEAAAAKQKADREAARKAKRDQARKARLDALRAARETKPPAISEADYNAAIRRLQSVTGENPTDPERKYTLPEGLEWFTEMLEALWPSIQRTCQTALEETVKPQVQGVLNDLPKVAHVDVSRFALGPTVPSFGPISTRRVKAWGLKRVAFASVTPGMTLRMVPEGCGRTGAARPYCGTVLRVRSAREVQARDRDSYPLGYVDVRWNTPDAGGPPEGVVPREPRDPTPLPRESRQSREWWEAVSGPGGEPVPDSGKGNPHVDDEGLQLNVGVSWRSDLTLVVSTNLGKAGCKGFVFNGTISLWLRPFVPRVPIVGAVEVGFVNPPRISVGWYGALLSLPGVKSTLQGIIDQQVANALVLPNRMAVPLDAALPRAQVAHPLPEGILRLTVLRCENLPSTDLVGKADPYVVLQVGASTRETEVKQNESNPTFGEGGRGQSFEFPVYDEEQHVFVEVRDEDVSGYDVIGQVHNLPVKQLLVRAIQQGGKPLAIPLSGPDGTCVFDGDDQTARVVLAAAWLGVDDAVRAEGDCLLSVQLQRLRFDRGPGSCSYDRIPAPGTLYVRMTADGYPRAPAHKSQIGTPLDARPVTRASVCDPAVLSSFKASEVLEDIRNWSVSLGTRATTECIAQKLGFFEDGDISLVEQALRLRTESHKGKRKGKSPGAPGLGAHYEIEAVAPLRWWQEAEHVQSWVIYRTPEQRRERGHDGRLLATWTLVAEDVDEVADDHTLDLRAHWYKRLRAYQGWCNAITAKYSRYKSAVEPFWGHVLHAYIPTTAGGTIREVRLDFIYGPPGPKEVLLGSVRLSDVRDSQQAEAIVSTAEASWETASPFDRPIRGAEGRVALARHVRGTLTGCGVWIRDVSSSIPLPPSWNTFQGPPPPDWQQQEAIDDYYKPESSPYEGQRWKALNWAQGQTREANPDELIRRAEWYEGRKEVAPQKKLSAKQRSAQHDALQRCLNCGALTWGDYDTLVRKLQGEDDVSTIAETLEWVNMLIAMMWVPIDQYLQDWTRGPLKEFIDATIAKYKKWGLKDVTIAKCSLGSRPLSVGTIQCAKRRARGGQNAWGGCYDGMVLKVNDILLDSNIEIEICVDVTLKRVTLGARNIFFRGSVEVELGPMLPRPPCVGGMRVAFPACPDVAIAFSGVGEVAGKVPGVNELVLGSVEGYLAQTMVCPNFFPVVLDPAADAFAMQFPEPIGVLEFVVTGAVDLVAGDSAGMMCKAGSDAFCVVSLSGCELRTPVVTVKRSAPSDPISPEWTEGNRALFVVYNRAQRVKMAVFDYDGWSEGFRDDSLGSVYDIRALVGGNELIVEGREVGELLTKTKHEFDLRFKKVDLERTDPAAVFHGETFHKLVNYPEGTEPEEGRDAKLRVRCRWLTAQGGTTGGKRASTFLVTFKILHLEGLPARGDGDLGAPYRMRLWLGPPAAQVALGGKHPEGKDPQCLLCTPPATARQGSAVAPLDILSDVQADLSRALGKRAGSPAAGISDSERRALAAKVAEKHNLSRETVEDLLERQTLLPDGRCSVRISFLIRREEQDTAEEVAGGGVNLQEFKQKCADLFKLVRDPHDPDRCKAVYDDGGGDRKRATETGLSWCLLGFTPAGQPIDILLDDKKTAEWAREWMPEGGDADLAVLTLGFRCGKDFLRWLRREGDELLFGLIRGGDPLSPVRLDPRPERGFPVSISATKSDLLQIVGEAKADLVEQAGGFERMFVQHRLTTLWHTLEKESRHRVNPDARSTLLVLYFQVVRGKMREWSQFRGRFAAAACVHRGVLSCCVQRALEHGSTLGLKQPDGGLETDPDFAPRCAITLICDDRLGRRKAEDEAEPGEADDALLDFPHCLGEGEEQFAQLTDITVITPAAGQFHLTDLYGRLEQSVAPRPIKHVQTETRSATKSAPLHGVTAPLEVHAKSLSWGQKASEEQQVNSCHRQPHFDRVLRAAVRREQLGPGGSCPYALGLMASDGETVRGLIKGDIPLDAGTAGGRCEQVFEPAEMPWLVPASGHSLLFNSVRARDGVCHLHGALSLQALAECRQT